MSGRIAVEIDLIGELENITNYDPDFSSENWRPMDTERLKRIVEYLDTRDTKARKIKKIDLENWVIA